MTKLTGKNIQAVLISWCSWCRRPVNRCGAVCAICEQRTIELKTLIVDEISEDIAKLINEQGYKLDD